MFEPTALRPRPTVPQRAIPRWTIPAPFSAEKLFYLLEHEGRAPLLFVVLAAPEEAIFRHPGPAVLVKDILISSSQSRR